MGQNEYSATPLYKVMHFQPFEEILDLQLCSPKTK